MSLPPLLFESLFRSLSPRSHLHGLSPSLPLLSPDSVLLTISPRWLEVSKAMCAIFFAESKTWKACVIACLTAKICFPFFHFFLLFNLVAVHLYFGIVIPLSNSIFVHASALKVCTFASIFFVCFGYSLLSVTSQAGCVTFISGCFFCYSPLSFWFWLRKRTQKYFWMIFYFISVTLGCTVFPLLYIHLAVVAVVDNLQYHCPPRKKKHAGALLLFCELVCVF